MFINILLLVNFKSVLLLKYSIKIFTTFPIIYVSIIDDVIKIRRKVRFHPWDIR